MTDPPSRTLRPVRSGDARLVDAVHALNQRWVPHVGSLTRSDLVRILDLSTLALAAGPGDGPGSSPGNERLDGFVIVMAPGVAYTSPNYRWFEERRAGSAASTRFHYVDRIAVAPQSQGEGVGRLLYDAVFDDARTAGVGEVTCEVNLDPPNPDSLAFHRRLGFVEVGRQRTYDGTVEVQLLARALRAGSGDPGAAHVRSVHRAGER